ncbi:YqjF family protein [Bacillus sp. AK128]
MYQELNEIDHRPFPAPSSPWVMTQTWDQLLFMHWPIPVEELKKHLPPQFEPDTFDGTGWIGLVPFQMNQVRMHGLPKVPYAHSFLELNVRTYVTINGKPGVYFFTLDANHKLAVTAARALFSLPYVHATMEMIDSNGTIDYQSVRTHRGYPSASYHVAYRPTSPVFTASKGSIEDWLTARYCLWTTKGKRVYRGDIHHVPWSLQQAEAEIKINKLTPFLPEAYFDTEPLLLFSPSIRAFVWMLDRVE